jgi:hypothetical protein
VSADAATDDYDTLLLAGSRVNPEKLRRNIWQITWCSAAAAS